VVHRLRQRGGDVWRLIPEWGPWGNLGISKGGKGNGNTGSLPGPPWEKIKG